MSSTLTIKPLFHTSAEKSDASIDSIPFIYGTGYEFDPGIHYIGEMDCAGSMRLLSDQLTEGQLQWAPLEKQFDTVVIGDAENARRYPVCGGRQDDYKKALYESFPKEKKAIDQYMNMLKVSLTFISYYVQCENKYTLAWPVCVLLH